MSSTLTDTDMIIVDIDNLVHKEKKGIGGGGGHDSCDETETEQTENYFLIDEPISDPSLDNQILKNLNQLETLVRVIRKRIVGFDLFSFELTRLDYLNARLNNMIELFEFYQAKRFQTSVSNFRNELKFIQYLLITRLNNLNSLFNMNQIDNFVLRKRDSENDCILNESPTEIKVLDVSNRKLRINSIQLDEQEFCEPENGDQNNTVDFMCAVYQFDNSNELKQLKQSLINASVVTTSVPLKTKASKRSSSADNYNSTLKRKLRQSRLQNSKSKLDQLESCQQQQLNDAQAVIDKMDDSFKLDEKCIAINSFKFKLKNSTHINECIQLEPNCTHLKIIVYKLIKLRTTGTNKTTSSNNQYKNPIKYVSINLAADTKSITNSFELTKSFKLDLKSFMNANAKRIVNSSRRSATKKETASSMLKRMFTKTKPSPSLETNHMNHVSRTSSQSAYDTECSNRINSTLIAFSKNEPHLSFECFVDMEISDSFSEQLIYDLDILNMNSLESWLALWRSDLKFSRNLKNSADNFEVLTVYLNKIESSLDAVAEDDEWLYFIQIKIETKIQDPTNGTNLNQSVNVFRSNLFRLNESINDLCRIPFEDGDLLRTSANEKILKFDLYRVDRTDMIRMVASNSVNLCQSRHHLIQLNELHLGHAVRFSNLKIKFSFQSAIYPMRRVAIDLFEFNLDSQNANRLLSLVEIFLNCKQSNNEWILTRKFLEFFSVLNDPAQLACLSTKIVNDVMTNRRMIRDLLIEKLFEAFLRLISTNEASIDMKLIVSGLKYSQNQLKLLSQFLANQVKSQFMERFTELTVKCFDKLIELIVYLSLNKSKYELKYEINDLITKTLKMESIDLKQQVVVYSNLKLDFVNLLVDLYSPYELADLMITKILSNNQNTHDAKETLILSFVNKNIFQLEFFKQNNQFRNRLVTFLIRTHLEKSFKLSSDHLELLKNLLRNKSRLSKQNLEDMIKRLLKELINQLINILKLNENLQEKKSLIQKDSMVTLTINSFLCLFDILKMVPDIKSLNKEFIGSLDLNCLFEIIIFYLKNSAKIASSERIQLKMNTIAIEFANFIQKHLQFYQITKNETDQSALIHSYFEMLFSFVNQSNVTFSLKMCLKLRMIRTIRSFWQSLGAQLKHSINLNEFLINKLCKCFMFNFYFKLFEFKPAAAKPISSNTHVYLSPFIGGLSSDSFVCKFYEECIGMLVDIYTVNCGSLFELEHLNEFILFSLMNWILSKENNAESRLSFCSNISSVSSQCESASSVSSNDFEFELTCETQKPIINKSIRNYSHQIMELIENIINVKQNDSDAIRRSILASVCVCIDYNLLKDECNETSTIENFLITYDLIKIVDDLNKKSVNKLFTCLAYLNENRRQIKMYLLDDLYGMYKSEKNFLQMSFVRKQQADLIEWNLNRKNESDLKEIFSLKSSKKFVINSLNDSLLQVSVVTPYSTSSISASSFSSSSSSSSSSISLGVPSSSATSATGLSTSLNSNTQLLNNTSNNTEISSSECFHHSDEVGKQIGAYYEKIDENYSKLSRILTAESKFASKSLNGQMYKQNINVNTGLQYHGNLYFRIGIFGSSFKSKSIQNKYFLYKHHSYEMLSNIQNLIINKLAYSNIKEANIVILHHNQEPDASIKENKENKCYLQLCAVNRLEKHKLIELIEEMNQCKETEETLNKLTGENYEGNDFYYYFDRPFYLRNNCSSNEKTNKSGNRIMDEHIKENESVENLWLERSILITDECTNKFETNLTQFEEVKNIHKILLNPLRNAINDINEKTKELKQFIAHFKSNGSLGLSYSSQIHNLQPLTMRLLGCLDARVNGGLIKYVKELFTQNLIESKSFNKKKLLFDNLYISIKDQLDVLKVGLNLHDGILKELNSNNRKFCDDHHESNNNVKNQKNYEHMNQLNGHLVDCFKLIDNELNERWSVAYSKLG